MSGKKYQQAREKVERNDYSLDEAIKLMQEVKFLQFDETA
jgi:ribosomal protein L1